MLTYPNAFVDASAEMLRKMAVNIFINDAFRHIGVNEQRIARQSPLRNVHLFSPVLR